MADENEEWKTVGGRRNKENCRGNPASLVQPGRGGGQRGRSQGRGQREARGGRGRGSSVDSGLGRGRVFGRQEQVPSLSTNQGNVSYIGDGKQVYASEKLNINKSGSNSLPDRGAGDVGQSSDHEISTVSDGLKTDTTGANSIEEQKSKDIAAALGLENRLQNEGYRCWVKDALCLQILKEGLETFADMKSKELHQKMLQELKKMGNPSVAKMCCSMAEINYDSGEIHCKTCKSDKKNVTLHELRGICQPIHVDDENCTICCNNANCTNCKEYMTVLNDYKAGNFMFSKESLQNADISKLHKEPWQLAKMFMNGGQDTGTVHPSDTDVSGILNFIKHCRICQESLAQGYLPDILRIRNEKVFHTPSMNVEKKEFKDHTDKMIVFLKNFLPDTNDAISKIHTVRNASFKITIEQESAVLKELVIEMRKSNEELARQIEELKKGKVSKEEFEAKQREINNKLRELWNWVEANAEETCNKDIQHGQQQQELKQDHQDLKQVLQKIIRDLQDLELQIEDTKKEQTQKVADKDCLEFQQGLIEENIHKFSQMNRSPIYDGINEGVEKVQFDEFYSDIDIRCRGGNTINSFLDIFAVKPCRNVLIKGVFGVGKSTFCRKLMLEWCKVHKKTHEPEIENKSLTEMEEALFPFQYLFFVDQSKGDYSSIQEAILSSLSRLPDCQEMLKHIFKEKSQSVLIIVDGIDENPNIEFKGVNQSTVLMTTDQSHCDNICSKVDFTIDKVLTISGLNEEGISNLRYKIIQSYNKTSPHDNIESMSQECKEYLADLDLSRCFSNPFMLKTLVINWICGTISASETCNALAMLKQFVLRAKTKSPEKEQANLPSCESSIFEDTIPSHLRDKTLYPHGNVMLNLGAYAYRGLIDSSQSFNRPMREYDFNEHLRVDFERCSKSMGFLTKETYTPEQGEKEITLSFLHHHFEQFFTALWIVSKQCENGEWLFSSKDFVTDQNKKARILSFVCGLNSMLGSQLSRHVIEMVTNDKELNKFRLEQTSSDCQKARGQYIHRESILDKFKAVGIEDEEMFVEIVKDALKCLEKITDILLQCMTEVFHSSTPAEPLVIADVIQTNKPLTENLVQLLEQSNEQLLTLFLYGCTVDSFPNLQRLSEAVSESVHLKALAIEITQAEGINLAVNFNLSSLAELRTCDILLPGHYNCRITLGENGLLESFQCRGVQMTQQEWLDLFMHLCESPKLSLLHIENASTVPTDEHTNHPTVGTEAEEINLPTGFRMHMTTVELPTSIWQYIFQLPQMEHITLLELNNVHIDCVNLDKASHLVVLWMSDVQSTEVIFPKSNMLGELSVKKSTFRRQWSWSNLFASLTNEMKRIHLEAVDITAAVFSEQLCSNIEKVSLIDVSMTYFDNLKLILDQKDDGHFTSSQTGNVVNLEFEVGVGTGYSS